MKGKRRADLEEIKRGGRVSSAHAKIGGRLLPVQ